MDDRITRIAARQHGAVGRRQLLATGLREGQVEGLVTRRRLRPASNGVYVVPGSAPTPRRDAMVAALRCGPGARISGTLALAMTGVDHLRRADGPTVLVRPGRRVRSVPWRVREDRWPGLGTTAVADGVPTWGVARNLLEAAVDLTDDDELHDVVDAVRWLPRTHLRRVRQLATSAPGHPGARRLDAIGALDGDAPESSPERWLVELLRDLGPRTQVEVAPGLVVDLLLPDARLVVEYDGRATHEGPRARATDADRDRRLRALGYLVVRVSSADRRDPQALRARIVAIAEAVRG